MGLDEAIEELDGVDAETFAERLQDERSELYKQVYSDGYGAGKTDQKSETEKVQSQLEELKSEKQSLESDLEELKDEQPEAAELRGKYESKLEEKQQQVEKLESQLDEVEHEKRQAIKQERRSILEERTKNRLLSEGVDEDYAEFRTQKAIEERVELDDDYQPTVYEEDGVPTPLNDNDPHEALAGNILSETPDKFISDNRPGETGVGDTGSTTGANTVTDEDLRKGNVDPTEILNNDVQVE